jgi:ABC-type phosphate transport system permease subunit
VGSLIYLALILLVFSLVMNFAAQWIVRRVGRSLGQGARA